MEKEYIEIFWTSGSLDEARRICRFLVQERLVACAQIIPWIESIYQWDNKLETSQECKIILKTEKDAFDLVKKTIEENCKYEVPEILWIPIAGGNASYLQWLKESIILER